MMTATMPMMTTMILMKMTETKMKTASKMMMGTTKQQQE
jgi:hypothetical protein